ncbi:DEAD/DEAH box helicase [Methanolobus halotolerans]|uniref:ATP-dependent RNA helicase n=1 Tax=Methanolobus halotolerans TaxID=2052935 RepID=A0A4E0PU90_9EURY|nr:DEAD/DEAH box helicase [Methanolobus halotolerans]TGC08353.1 ATP-dependent RNA helicase [Methanolobus halotolerans]
MENKTFKDLNLSEETIRSIREMGYLEPTEIQSQAIPLIMEGKDIIGQAKTGTGKTAAFGIPLAELIDQDTELTQAMILCPTRELANQVAEELAGISKYKKGLSITAVYGGRSMGQQTQDLENGVQIVVGTPGRIIDHIERQHIKMDNIRTMILDEADEMLKMGFREAIEKILDLSPKKRQTLLFSATMPKPILRITDVYMQSPQHIKITGKEMTVPEVKQYYYEMKDNMKVEALHRLIDVENIRLALVFCNTIKEVDKLYIKLGSRGHAVETLHGDIKQKRREKTIGNLQEEKINIIIATDVAARGIDIDNIEAVVNYDLPQEIETYIHRIGRTARAGRPGTAYSFVSKNEIGKLTSIQRHTKTKIVPREIPSVKDVEKVKEAQVADRVRMSIRSGNLQRYDEWVEKLAAEGISHREIAASLAKLLLKEGKNRP